MSFPEMTSNVNIIAQLGDEPNEDNGLTAAALKSKFDEAAVLLKAAHNALVSALNAADASENIGFSSDNIDGNNVNAALENLRTYLLSQMQGMSQGTVSDGSITTAKLDDDAVTGAKVADSTLRTADVNGYTVMTLASLTGASTVHNSIKLHYIRSLGMVFFKGNIQFMNVTNAGTLTARFSFDHYKPVGGIAAFSSDYYGA